MPKLKLNGAEIHYTVTGAGPESIVFSHGLMMSGRMFDAQVEAFADRYRCITFDFRGQGQSEVTRTRYDMDSLTEDAAALIEAFDCAPCHFVGLSMGGFVGLRLAIRHPELLRSLTLIETTADPEPVVNLPRYRRLNVVARWLGMRMVVKPVMAILFGKTFMSDPEREQDRQLWRRNIVGNDRIGITRAVRAVIDRAGVYAQLGEIGMPTLILVGDEDVATVPAKSESMQAAIEGSQLVVIPRAGHSSTVEEPAAVNRALEGFLAALSSEA